MAFCPVPGYGIAVPIIGEEISSGQGLDLIEGEDNEGCPGISQGRPARVLGLVPLAASILLGAVRDGGSAVVPTFSNPRNCNASGGGVVWFSGAAPEPRQDFRNPAPNIRVILMIWEK